MSAMGAGSCRTDFHACATAARRHIFTRRDFPCGDFAPDSRFSNVRKPGCGESKGSLVEARPSHERSHCFALKKFFKNKVCAQQYDKNRIRKCRERKRPQTKEREYNKNYNLSAKGLKSRNP